MLNKILVFVSCGCFALAINDLIFQKNIWSAVANLILGIFIMPGFMNFNFSKANNFQRFLLILIAVLNTIFWGYLFYKFILKGG
jgi:hypothetical protein